MIPLCPNVTNPRGLGFWGFSVLGKGGKLKKKNCEQWLISRFLITKRNQVKSVILTVIPSVPFFTTVWQPIVVPIARSFHSSWTVSS